MTTEIKTIDIAVAQNVEGIYDISFDDNGDFVRDRSYETAIRMSLFLDARADVSDIKPAELRRGWWGNGELYSIPHEIGSKLWLLQQRRNTVKARNDAIGYVKNCLQWLIDDNHAEKVEITASSEDVFDMILDIKITYSADLLETFRFNLWSNTKEL